MQSKTNKVSPPIRSVSQVKFLRLYGEVKESLRRGELDERSLEKAEELRSCSTRSQLSRLDERARLKIRSVLCEMLCFFGRFDAAREVLQGGLDVVNQLPMKAISLTQPERLLFREQIRFSLDYAHAFFYRTHNYDMALAVVDRCRQLAESGMADDHFPCCGTLAQLHHELGKINRQTFAYSEARENFDKALEFYRRKAERSRDIPERSADEIFACHRSAICLALGHAWLSYTQARLREAKLNCVTSRLLLGNRDRLTMASLNLFEATIDRAIAGSNDGRLQEIERTMRGAHDTFMEFGHLQYAARAAYQLAILLYLARRYDAAEMALVDAESILGSDPRWQCNILVVRSRIARHTKPLDDAIKIAQTALLNARRTTNPLCEIDALIASAEAKCDLAETMKTGKHVLLINAREELLTALELNDRSGAPNVKITAVCNLHLAKVYAIERDTKCAGRSLRLWHNVKGMIEHSSVRELGDLAEERVQQLNKDFVVSRDGDTRSYGEVMKELRDFLLRRAEERANGNINRISKDLRISRQTYYEWKSRSHD